jgi:hypothetical protein
MVIGHNTCFIKHARNPNQQPMWQLFKEFLAFLKQEKKWWLLPLIVLLLLLGAILVFATSSGIVWAIYPLF